MTADSSLGLLFSAFRPKLEISHPGDPLELQADAAADRVVDDVNRRFYAPVGHIAHTKLLQALTSAACGCMRTVYPGEWAETSINKRLRFVRTSDSSGILVTRERGGRSPAYSRAHPHGAAEQRD